MEARFSHSSAPMRRVKKVQFGVLSPEEIKSLSVVNVQSTELYEEGTTRPKKGGLADPVMGTIDRNFKCETCSESPNECPGHFGHIELARPVYHIGFLNKVKKILESVCVHCGKLKLDASNPKLALIIRQFYRDPKKRLLNVHLLVSSKNICETDAQTPEGEEEAPIVQERLPHGLVAVQKGKHGGCGQIQPKIRKDGIGLQLVYDRQLDEDGEAKVAKSTERKPLSAMDALRILRKIPDIDLDILGCAVEEARPEWMIITVLPVPPPAVRPSISVDGGAMRGEDDLTYKLLEILKCNSAVRKIESEGQPAHVMKEMEGLLQYHIATYMDNDIAGQPQALQKSGRPIKSIRARLKGKEGRLRGNLMGKRVDFSARTVITGDPNIDLDQVGVPYSIARTLTYPERVTPYNIAHLQDLVRNGPNTHPGARYVVRDTGDRIDLRYNKRDDTSLQYGWIVERHLQDGDVVLFNRQPSLHKMSMMAHRVKLMPYSTFRLNLSVTPPYNADFDGDEMNLHVPQSEETRAELKEIAAVPRQIISPQANKPVMGIVQDTLCGIRKFTLRDCFMDRDFVQNILLWVPGWDGVMPTPAILKPKPLWTGKQILSMCIPSGINIRGADEDKLNSSNPGDKGMWIEDGEIIYGVVAKKIAGASAGGLIDVIFREKGHIACRDFFSAAQKVVNYWLLHNGFSIGIGDTIADTDTMNTITTYIETAKNEVSEVIHTAQQDLLDPLPGMTIRESFESKVNTALNTARDSAGKSAEESLKFDNNVKQMVVAGSKGSFINISQMSACVGQQNVEGKRIPFGFKYRTLPHFAKDDYSPEARGFVENSYLRGLTPQEFFFHAMAGREGLIDTAVKTAETGYIQRRLVKALEDVQVAYDGTVRNSLGHVVQFVYGEDGMDGASFQEQQMLPHALSDDAFERTYLIDLTAGSDSSANLPRGVVSAGVINPDEIVETQDVLDSEYNALLDDRRLLREFVFQAAQPRIYMPVNIRRIIQNARQLFRIAPRDPSDLPPIVVVEDVRALAARLTVVRGSDAISQEAQANVTLLFGIHLRANLAVRRLLVEDHLTREAFTWVLGEIESRFYQAIAAPGEMCGTLAAQSIGEPATQMTLNTFHYAGVSSKNVTLGVPRLKEIINVARNLKTPFTYVYLRDEISRDRYKAKEVHTRLAHTTLRTVTSSVEVFYDPEITGTVIEDDKDFVDAYFAIPDEEVERTMHLQSPWLLRFELDRPKMLDKGLKMADVAERITGVFGSDLFVTYSEDNAEKLVIRCRPSKAASLKEEEEMNNEEAEEDVFLKQLEAEMLDHVSLGGISGIDRVFMVEKKRAYVDNEGSLGQRDEWVLETDGINLKDVLCEEGVDSRRTYSNSCVEITEVLGIEAGRASLLRELRNVIEFDGSYVNYRHLSLLCDLMTNRGQLMSITRHGINRAETSALMRCSFEETVEILMDAAATGEKDTCSGVAENVLLGQLAPLGTGSFEVALNVEMLKDVVVDARLPISRFDLAGGMTPGAMTPYLDGGKTPMPSVDGLDAAAFSPQIQPGQITDINAGFASPYGGGMSPFGASPGWSPASPAWGGTSPMYATSPALQYSPSSPRAGGTSPSYMTSPTSPFIPGAGGGSYSPSSPAINLTSPRWTPTSPSFSPASPNFSPSSPRFSPSSPSFSPASPRFSPASPSFSPASPRYSPTSPRLQSPSSPRWSPSSPAYSPASPQFTPAGTGRTNQRSPTSPVYSPSSPQWSPASPAGAAGYSPASPAYSPTSPGLNGATSNGGQHRSPTAPAYSTSPSWMR